MEVIFRLARRYSCVRGVKGNIVLYAFGKVEAVGVYLADLQCAETMPQGASR